MKTVDFHWAIPLSMALSTALLLTACGGGDHHGTYYPPTTGTSDGGGAQASDPYGDFLAYVTALLGMAPETAEAADVAKFDPPPTSETKEAVTTP